MALLPINLVTNTWVAPPFVAAALSDTVPYSAGGFVVYRNTNVATRTVTVVVPGNTSYGELLPDPVRTLAATTGELWIPLRPEYQDPTTGLVTLNLSVITNVTVTAVRLT